MLNLVNGTKQIDEIYFNCINIHEYLKELLKFIKNNHTIKHLNVNHSSITDDDLKQICEVIKENDTLISLNFAANYNITNIIPICDLIHSNKNISELYLNMLSSCVDFKPLFETLKTNDTIKVFEMYDDNNIFNNFCEMLKVNKSITTFAYKGNDKIDMLKLKEVLDVNKNITSINLNENKSDNWSLLAETLMDNKNVTRLNLNECNILDYKPFYNLIKCNSMIKSLFLKHIYNMIDNDYKVFLDALQTNKTLEILDVNGLKIEDALEYLKIVYVHPKLKEINIELDIKHSQIICNVLYSAKGNIANIGYQPCINYEQFYKSKDENKRLSQFIYA